MSQYEQFKDHVTLLSGSSWLSSPMQSKVEGTNQFIYEIKAGINALVLDFTISIYNETAANQLMFVGKIFWNGEAQNISYLSMGTNNLLSTGTITINGNVWTTHLKWIEPDGKTTALIDSMEIHDNELIYNTKIQLDDGKFQSLPTAIWQKVK